MKEERENVSEVKNKGEDLGEMGPYIKVGLVGR